MTTSEQSVDASPTEGSESPRITSARSRAQARLTRQRDALRPLGWAVIVIVVAGSLGARPAPGLDGAKPIGILLALGVFGATLGLGIRNRFPDRPEVVQVAVIALMGAAGIAIGALQPRGASELAAGAAVWFAVARLPGARGIGLAVTLTIALDVATALAGSSASAVLATTLLCALLGLIAYFLRQSRDSQDRTELLLAELEDARAEQTRAAAIAERARIAGELHDVLAHSLSGAAIQLQGARMMADREQAGDGTRGAIDRASELVRAGLTSARQAVGALRGDELPSITQLSALVDSFRTDMRLEVALSIQGEARLLPADGSLALYRGAQEALTNVARYAPGAAARVELRYEPHGTRLTVENGRPARAGRPELAGVGGGRGLEGMRERIERAGGSMRAGPQGDGWCVALELPA